jgi:hypothetical protein
MNHEIRLGSLEQPPGLSIAAHIGLDPPDLLPLLDIQDSRASWLVAEPGESNGVAAFQ